MSEKINKLISVRKEIWDVIREKFNSINDYDFTNDDIVEYKFQGSVSTKTLVNPLTSKRKNDLDMDLLVIINKPTSDIDIDDLRSKVRKDLRDNFGLSVSTNEKALTMNFDSFYVDGCEIKLSMDVVLFSKVDNEIFNNKTREWEYSNPLSISNGFNSNPYSKEKRFIVKLLKSLRDVFGIKGLKSVHIVNAVSRSGLTSIDQINVAVNELQKEIETLRISGETNSFFDDEHILDRPDDFEYDEISEFLKNILDSDFDHFEELIENAQSGKYPKSSENDSVYPVHSK